MKQLPYLLKFGMKPNSILHASVAHGTLYEENPSSNHGGMHQDEHRDRQIERWTDGPIPVKRSQEYSF